jgi:hypothetical protein
MKADAAVTIRYGILVTLLTIMVPATAAAGWDLSVWVGKAYPTYDQELVVRFPTVPVIPGMTIDADGVPEIRGNGGPVYGGSIAYDGIFGLEGRLDLVEVAVEFTGAQYNVAFSPPAFGTASGRLTVGDVTFEPDRLKVISLNARLRTPGPVGLFASGGFSYLPGFEARGTVPLSFQLQGISGVAQPTLRVRVDPEETEHSFGVNGGGGVRIGGRVGVFAEARVFYFKSYELNLAFDDAQPLVDLLLDEIDPVRFRPVIFNAVVGLSIRVPGL